MDKVSALFANSLYGSYRAQYSGTYPAGRQSLAARTNPFQVQSPWWDTTGNQKLVVDLLGRIREIKEAYIEYRFGIQAEQTSNTDYDEYLQFPNKIIKQQAAAIVDAGDSNDEKAYKITQWVIDNIQYQSDLITYGLNEYWAYPAMTLNKKAGDCEDGAFLIHSLLLHAGLPPDRIRTYGGNVLAGEGAQTGGHGWTVYQRESDDQWVVLDWCYFPSQAPVDQRIPMKDDTKYIDDYFFVSLMGTVETPYANAVRNPAVGKLVNVYA